MRLLFNVILPAYVAIAVLFVVASFLLPHNPAYAWPFAIVGLIVMAFGIYLRLKLITIQNREMRTEMVEYLEQQYAKSH